VGVNAQLAIDRVKKKRQGSYYAECHHAECHVWGMSCMLNVINRVYYCYAECHFAECRYAECHCAVCHSVFTRL
jgi:hypothetical protein